MHTSCRPPEGEGDCRAHQAESTTTSLPHETKEETTPTTAVEIQAQITTHERADTACEWLLRTLAERDGFKEARAEV